MGFSATAPALFGGQALRVRSSVSKGLAAPVPCPSLTSGPGVIAPLIPQRLCSMVFAAGSRGIEEPAASIPTSIPEPEPHRDLPAAASAAQPRSRLPATGRRSPLRTATTEEARQGTMDHRRSRHARPVLRGHWHRSPLIWRRPGWRHRDRSGRRHRHQTRGQGAGIEEDARPQRPGPRRQVRVRRVQGQMRCDRHGR